MAVSSSSSSSSSSFSSSSIETRSSSSSSSSVQTKSSSSSSSSSSPSSSSSVATKSSSSSSSSVATKSSSSSSSSSGSNTYITKAECVELLSSFGITITTADIHNITLESARETLEDRAGTTWSQRENATLFTDGRGHRVVFCPVTPIVELDEVAVIAKDMSVTTYDLTGDDRQVWWDRNTGKIEIIKWDPDQNIAVSSPSQWTYFTEGVRNVRIKGVFGKEPSSKVKLAQALIVYEILNRMNASKFPGDIKSERMGNYRYDLTGKVSYTEYLNNLIDELGDADSMGLEEI